MKKSFPRLLPYSSALYVAVLSLLLGGCGSGITVTRLTPSDRVPKGTPWNLAMTQFDLTIIRQVTHCGMNPEDFKGNVEVKITPRKVLDENQRYVLYSDGWYSTSDIKSKLAPDGTSTGLNVQSENMSATIISNVVGLFAKVAAIAPMAVTKERMPNVCSDAVVNALYDLNAPPKLKKQLKDKTKELAGATSKVTLLTAQVKLDNSYKIDLAKALGEQAKSQAALIELQTKFEKDMSVITDTQTVSWPLRADQFRADDPYTISDTLIKSWLSPARVGEVRKGVKSAFSVYLALYQQDAHGAWNTPQASPSSDTTVGVPIRLAKVGRLLACTGEKCPDKLEKQWQADDFTKSTDQVVLQLGQVYTIPVTGGAFRSQVANIEMDEKGLPTSIEVSEKVAGAAAMTGTAKDAASQIVALPGQISDALKSKADLAAAEANAQIADEKSAIDAQTALIKSKTALKEAEAAKAAADKAATP